MRLGWVVHRFDRAANDWVDADGDAVERTAGVVADADPELELSLHLDGELLVRDVVWPLAWHLCLEPVTGLADGTARWSYRGFATGTLYDLHATGDVVEFGRAGEPPVTVPASLWWPVVVGAGCTVVAAAERDRGPDDANVGMLRGPRDRAVRALAALGPRAPRAGPVGGDAPGADDPVTIVRSTGDHERLDTSGLAGLLLAYHLQTEAEKGVPVPGVAGLPERYRCEVEDPRDAFRGQSVLVASTGSQAVGCVVLTAPQDGRCEIKRLWTDPSCRGRGVASSLVDAALAEAAAAGAATVELTVWRWRTAAIAWYERLGFARCAPRDDRAGLVRMQRKGFA